MTYNEDTKLVGLDFETANYRTGSICSVGLALVQHHEVVRTLNRLVLPHRSMRWITPKFQDIHGISEDDVRDAPEFNDVWYEMADFIAEGDCVVIHNARFDLTHLHAALALYGLSAVRFPYVCSLALSRKHFRGLPSHSLNNVAASCGITFKHHDALDDAATCARLLPHMHLKSLPARTFEFVPDVFRDDI